MKIHRLGNEYYFVVIIARERLEEFINRIFRLPSSRGRIGKNGRDYDSVPVRLVIASLKNSRFLFAFVFYKRFPGIAYRRISKIFEIERNLTWKNISSNFDRFELMPVPNYLSYLALLNYFSVPY